MVNMAINKHSEYVLLVHLPLQQWFRESTSLLRKNQITFLFFLWRCGPTRAMASSFMRFLDHTQRRITVGRIPLDGWSARHRDLYLTTHNTHNRQTSMAPGGIRIHNLSRRAAADLRLISRGHWDRHYLSYHPMRLLIEIGWKFV